MYLRIKNVTFICQQGVREKCFVIVGIFQKKEIDEDIFNDTTSGYL
jgi:hypothetical protein